MFSKRHYEAIALVMQEQFPAEGHGTSEADNWARLRDGLAHMFARDNHRFNWDTFIQRCEPCRSWGLR